MASSSASVVSALLAAVSVSLAVLILFRDRVRVERAQAARVFAWRYFGYTGGEPKDGASVWNASDQPVSLRTLNFEGEAFERHDITFPADQDYPVHLMLGKRSTLKLHASRGPNGEGPPISIDFGSAARIGDI